MSNPQLFLGVHLTEEMCALLPTRSPFIGNDDEGRSLHRLDVDGKSYLGKMLPQLVETPSLELIAENIYTLLASALPDVEWAEHRLVILPWHDQF